jgi:hypothetical protein
MAVVHCEFMIPPPPYPIVSTMRCLTRLYALSLHGRLKPAREATLSKFTFHLTTRAQVRSGLSSQKSLAKAERTGGELEVHKFISMVKVCCCYVGCLWGH